MSSSYSEDLWGAIKLVYDRYEEGKNTLAFLINFFKESATINEKNASKIQKLCLKSANWTEKGTCKESWETVKKWHEDSFKYYNVVSSQLNTMVLQPLMQIKKDQEIMKTNLVKEVTKLEQTLEKSRDALSKAKAKYMKSCRDYEFSTLELRKVDSENLKPKEIEKLKVKNINDKTAAENSHTAYKQLVQEHRSIQQNYASSIKKILNTFQEMDEKRLEVIKEALHQFSKAQETLIDSFKGEIGNLIQSITNMDAKGDVQEFIDANKSDASPEPLVEYEPYKSENNVDVPADIVTPTNDSDNDSKLKKTKSFKKDKKTKKSRSSSNLEESAKIRKSKKTEKKKSKDGEESSTPADDQSVSETKEGESKEETSVAETPREDETESEVKTASVAGTEDSSMPIIAISLYDYEKQDDTEITFAVDSLIVVTKNDGEVEDCPGWMEGKYNGETGLFPANRVKVLDGLRKCKVQFHFEPQNDDELELHEGEEVYIVKEHEKWFYGCNSNGFSGLFPENYVTLL